MPDAHTNRARSLRSNQSEAERVMWSDLRAHRLADLKFKRQQPIGPYTVDFYCAQAKLIIELDGQTHANTRHHDAKRDTYLSSLGYEVLRITVSEFMKSRRSTLEAILSAALRRITNPPPSPPDREVADPP